MPDVGAVLKVEVARLARKEVRQQVGPLKKTIAEQRRTIAELRRQVAALSRGQAQLQKAERRLLAEQPNPPVPEKVRYSPKWVASDRRRLSLSARDYGRLVGVSGQTVYSWEEGKSRPRAAALARWNSVRGIGKREAVRRLELLAG